MKQASRAVKGLTNHFATGFLDYVLKVYEPANIFPVARIKKNLLKSYFHEITNSRKLLKPSF